MVRIDCERVTKRFTRSAGPKLLRAHLTSLIRRRAETAETKYFYALRNVSFQVSTGESVALVGLNGAGKSTLLSLITGLAMPDEGAVRVSGKTAALLELGSGFHPDLTGAENLMLNAALLGFSRRETFDRFDDIVAFAELGEFIDEPLRTYSSGMVLRLAFSIAVNLDPDILIIDEILAVGDQGFQEKCFEKILGFRRAGKTIFAVSHATGLLLNLCDRAIWLEHGEVVMDGEIRTVLQRYDDSIRQTHVVSAHH